ncbi:hypothetical protein C8A05DRAFT_34395 [Staphylotrichum tortipilum]|uniref:Uncharacterized protein n=1 Tax=Staphylotrichum tortipilum TaxID=2831512 RepID=A0AAN6MKG2_9PEZI|nr:hypothetical protein C8A05DRAFT_34395 [Staphylotrichum longicolle]
MPPTLDLSGATHTKVVFSPPRINLRRAASYNHDRGPLSSTSSRFHFNHLVFSPPPSPGLPSLSPPVKKPSRRVLGTIRPLRVVRYAIRLLSIVVVFYISLGVLTWLFGEPAPAPTRPSPHANAPPPEPAKFPDSVTEKVETVEVEMVSQDGPPDFPTPMVVRDHRGRAKWTVSIPSGAVFPLSVAQYKDMCARCRQVAERTRTLKSQGHGLNQVSLGFGSNLADDFVDVQEAEMAGYLGKDSMSPARGSAADKPVCKTSLTFVLESTDAGMGKTLMMLWMAYGLAEKEGRAFFIDDTRWAYGKYSSIFQPPPQPKCSPPPNHERLPCPRHARHLVASAATATDELFEGLTKSAAEPSTESHDRAIRKAQFALARRGYEALARVNEEDSHYVDARARELMAKRIVPKSRGQRNGLAVGVHVRRGDVHPLEYQYRRSYVPLNVYGDAAREVIEARFRKVGPLGGEDKVAREQSIVVLASDDPTVYDSAELAGASRAQERIKLASKQTIQKMNPDRSVLHKFVDETFGWEGGFFAAMFWNLGRSTAHAGSGPDGGGGGGSGSSATSAETLRLRSLVGRAYMMDLTVLAEVSDVMVCTVSAAGCRLLAVMMGWESAVEEGNWVNIDGGYEWMGIEGW